MKYVICDIDGTIADLTHRLPYIQKEQPEWDAFFEACGGDAPIFSMIDLVRRLRTTCVIAFVTGRPERSRHKTQSWLYRYVGWEPTNDLLAMRKDTDHRNDHIVKKELFEHLNVNKHNVLAVFEDRDRVVEMWREMGLLCLQPKKGDY